MRDRQEDTVSDERSKEVKEFLARFVAIELGEAEKTLESLQSASPEAGRAPMTEDLLSGYSSASIHFRYAACVIHANQGRADDVRDVLARGALARLQVFELQPTKLQEDDLLKGGGLPEDSSALFNLSYTCATDCLDGFRLSLGAGEFGIARRLAGFARHLPLRQDIFTDIKEPAVNRPLAYAIRELVENHSEGALAHLASVVPTTDDAEEQLFQADMIRGMATGDVGLFSDSLGRLLNRQARLCAEQPFPVDIAVTQLCLPALAMVNLALYRQFLTLAVLKQWIGDNNPHLPFGLVKVVTESPRETVALS